MDDRNVVRVLGHRIDGAGAITAVVRSTLDNLNLAYEIPLAEFLGPRVEEITP